MEAREYKISVNNVSKEADNYDYIICRFVASDGSFWYYGADNDYERCIEIAHEIGNGFVVKND